MEIVSCCTGRAWRTRLLVTSEALQKVVEVHRKEAGVEASWRRCGQGLWLEGPRKYANDADPLLEVRVADGRDIFVSASLGGSNLLLSNEGVRYFAEDEGWDFGDHVRLAGREEALELVLRWLLLWGHMGCEEPDAVAFWKPETRMTAIAVDAPTRWLAAGAPLPYRGSGNCAFVAYCGEVSFSRFEDLYNQLAKHWGDTYLAGGIYVGERREYALVAIGRTAGEPSPPAGSR